MKILAIGLMSPLSLLLALHECGQENRPYSFLGCSKCRENCMHNSERGSQKALRVLRRAGSRNQTSQARSTRETLAGKGL